MLSITVLLLAIWPAPWEPLVLCLMPWAGFLDFALLLIARALWSDREGRKS